MKKESKNVSQIRPAMTPEAEEEQMISLAVNLAKQQLLDGTASSQVITHFLKLGTEREKLEREKIKKDIAVQEAKAKAYDNAENMQELYAEAITAMREYSGGGGSVD